MYIAGTKFYVIVMTVIANNLGIADLKCKYSLNPILILDSVSKGKGN